MTALRREGLAQKREMSVVLKTFCECLSTKVIVMVSALLN